MLKAEKHPDKTFIGKADRGFDFLGYFLMPSVIRVASGTIKKCAQRISQLYEQGAGSVRIGLYVRHWVKWVRTGLPRPYRHGRATCCLAGITGTDKILINRACPSNPLINLFLSR